MRLLHWMLGYDRYQLCGAPERVFQALMDYNLSFWGGRRLDGETGEFFASRRLRRRIAALCEKEKVAFHITPLGLPRWIKRYQKRWGLAVGAALFFLLLDFASSHVWEVRVADRSVDPVLRQKLALAGLYEGLASAEFDNSRFSAAFLGANPEYSFVSAGIEGGTALVWLNERAKVPGFDNSQGGANLIASYGGEILHCEAAYGQVMVTHGDRVEEGQLLVSGVVETKTGGFRVESAQGKVYARTQRDFETKIPLQREEKVYTGEEKVKKSINILGKNINFFSFYGKNSEIYDTIETREDVVWFGCLRMPFSVTQTTYARYRVEAFSLSEEQASRMAYDELYRYLAEDLREAEVVDTQVTVAVEEGAMVLRAKLSLIEDIAQTQAFSYWELLTDPSSEESGKE